ncbi:MAG TPA: sugar-binding transcriptional regulator [Ktedonobacteraceae bacterium]|jgi:DNA-binding transcriptional regulator LsrR (DeoR family)
MQESDDLYLLAEVASLYYEENQTQEQIAKAIGVSRSGVSRLLTRSRELGLVDIHVHYPLRTSTALRTELLQKFPMQDAQILTGSATDEPILSFVGALAARYVDRRIQESYEEKGAPRTVGISWGTSMFEMLKVLRPRRRLPLNIVQLMGSVDTPSMPDINGPEIARRLADAYGGHCSYIHAPLLVTNSVIRDGLLEERSIQRTFQMMEQMDIALVGIGGASPEVSGLFRAGYLGTDELQEIRKQGAVGDICGTYFNINGEICAHEVLDRTVTVSFETLRRVPLVIAVAAGIAKVEAIIGGLRTGIVDVLITDEQCTSAILQRLSSVEVVPQLQ